MGDGLDFLILDEYALHRPGGMDRGLRAALADKQGRAHCSSERRGVSNHFYDLVESAQTNPDWKAFHFTTAEGGNVSREELESASKEMDQRTYCQEFGSEIREPRCRTSSIMLSTA